MERQTEPIIIIAGTPYPGIYKKEVFAHLSAKLAEENAIRAANREGRKLEVLSFLDGMDVMTDAEYEEWKNGLSSES